MGGGFIDANWRKTNFGLPRAIVFRRCRLDGTLKKRFQLLQVFSRCRMDDDGPACAGAFDSPHAEAVPLEPPPHFRSAQSDIQISARAFGHGCCQVKAFAGLM
jgi:hypothetical protein